MCENQPKPVINPTSKQLAKPDIPIHERFYKMIERKNQKIDLLRRKYHDEKVRNDPDYYPKFEPELNENSKKLVGKRGDFLNS